MTIAHWNIVLPGETPMTDLPEYLNLIIAHIRGLEARVTARAGHVRELDTANGLTPDNPSGRVGKAAADRIGQLEAQLAQAELVNRIQAQTVNGMEAQLTELLPYSWGCDLLPAALRNRIAAGEFGPWDNDDCPTFAELAGEQ